MSIAQSLATLESPTQGSFESGVGLIRGWVCSADRVEVSINGGPLRPAAYGTPRGDTVGPCGDDDNGFGLTFNWNNLGDGVHNLRALADGIEFANVNFVVTTLGTDFLTNVQGEYDLADFPNTGDRVTVGWAEPHQNFVFLSPVTVADATNPMLADARLESPTQGSFESGVGLIRGWVCSADRVEISINGGPLRPAAYGTPRGDTVGPCGDDNNGFGLTFNWNNLGDGEHNLRAFADGVEFANVNFAVTTLGGEFLTDVSGEYSLPGFPEASDTTTVRWSQPHQNLIVSRSTAAGEKIGTVAAITDLLNPLAIVGLGANQTDSVGVRVTKNANGEPTAITGIDWASLDDSFWASLILGLNGLPSRYEDSSGTTAELNVTDAGTQATFFDLQGRQIAGPLSLPVDLSRLLNLQGLFGRLSNSVQTAATMYAHNAKAIHMAAAAESPFSIDALLLDLLWAGSVASEEMLCAVQSGATGAGLGNLDAAQGCSSALLQGFAELADADSGSDPAVQQALNFSEDVTEAPCDANSGSDCLDTAGQDLKAREEPVDPEPENQFPLTFIGSQSFTIQITPEWGNRVSCEPAKINLPIKITLFADGSAELLGTSFRNTWFAGDDGICESSSITADDSYSVELSNVHANEQINWISGYNFDAGAEYEYPVSGAYGAENLMMQGQLAVNETTNSGESFSFRLTNVIDATAQQGAANLINVGQIGSTMVAAKQFRHKTHSNFLKRLSRDKFVVFPSSSGAGMLPSAR